MQICYYTGTIILYLNYFTKRKGFCKRQVTGFQGGVIFEKQIRHLSVVALCQIVFKTPIKKFTLKCCFLTWRRASEKFDCDPKITQRKNVHFLNFVEGKNKEKLKKLFFLCPSKTNLPILGLNKMFNIFKFRNLVLSIVR